MPLRILLHAVMGTRTCMIRAVWTAFYLAVDQPAVRALQLFVQ